MKNKLGISIIPSFNLEKNIKLCLKIKECGINLITISDYHKAGSFLALFPLILKSLKEINLGTAVTNFLIHSPWEILNFFLTLKKTFKKEIFLGISTGDWFLIKKFGLENKEAIDNLIFGIKEIRNELKKEKIPIYIGAQGKKMLEISTKFSDGTIINLANYEDINKALKIIKNNDKKIFVISQVYVNKKRDKAIEEARKYATIIYSGLSNSSLKIYNYNKNKRDKIRKLILKNKINEARKILNEEDIKRLTICGNIKDLKIRIRSILELNIDKIILGLPMGKDQEKVFEEIKLLFN